MWLRVVIPYVLWIHITPALSHLPQSAELKPGTSKVDEFCDLADTCIHDTIPICGVMGSEKRTFMDLCDLIEYGCDNNQLYSHVDDEPGCPVFKKEVKRRR